MNSINNICIYTRVSTRQQSNDTKYGLSSQKQLCNDYLNNFYPNNKNISYWEDVGSSYKKQNILSEMSRMMTKLKPNSLIVVSEVSRLGRSVNMVSHLLKIVKRQQSFIVSASENLIYGKSLTYDKQFMKNIIDSEKESDVLSMRIKNIQSYIKKNGGYIGKAPFGYTVSKNSKNIPVLKENPQDFQLIDHIVNLSNDCCTYDEIKDKMNIINMLHNNKLWTSKKIKEILNKFYPEHMLLNINDKTVSNIIIVNENENDDNRHFNQSSLYTRRKNTKFEQLQITISNNQRVISYTPSNSIKLRSGRIINNFF